eukprot:GHVP01041682.1.p1 GENE.GHVP01041682.1~~GHVP01041682.1.p1  ORF type:complete len:473 (-),score=64.54 GHVP01041682.1:1744-3162(-)
MRRVDNENFELDDGSIINTKERALQYVQLPKREYLEDADFFELGIPNPELIFQHFRDEGLLTQNQATAILTGLRPILYKEPNLIEVSGHIIICGDIHGQYLDLVTIMESNGFPNENNKYLFLGDYVDRGHYSLECFLLLAALKIKYPEYVYLLRGNHESARITNHFSFRKECIYKQGNAVYNECVECFEALPLAAVVDKKIFCVHGGISPSLDKLEDINKQHRFGEIPTRGLVNDLLWSDPHPYDFESDNSFDFAPVKFKENINRRTSYFYTYAGVESFLKSNGLESIIRGHEVQMDGFLSYKKYRKLPSVISLFSAPNYTGAYKNKAAWINYTKEGINIRQFTHRRHSYNLPNFDNAFGWSLPYIIEKTDIILMQVYAEYFLAEIDQVKDQNDLCKIADNLAGTMHKLKTNIVRLKDVRKNHETNTELLNLHQIDLEPGESLAVKDEDIKMLIDSFEDAHSSDSENEEWKE